jgi:hypothetical protein
VYLNQQVSGGGREVEDRGAGGTEVDSHRLCVVRVHVHAGRGDHSVECDRAAQCIVQSAAGEHAVGVQLERSAGLLALEHVFHKAVGKRQSFVRHVGGCRTSAVAETWDVGTERNVLAGSLTDRCNVNLGPGDLEAPVADLTDYLVLGVGNLELVGAGGNTVIRDGDGAAAFGCGDLQHAGGCCVSDHVVGGAGGDTSGEGAGAGAAGLAVHHAENNGVTNPETEIRSNGDLVVQGIYVGLAECADGSSGFVVEGAGRAGQYGRCHWLTKMDGVGGHCPAYYRLAPVFTFITKAQLQCMRYQSCQQSEEWFPLPRMTAR